MEQKQHKPHSEANSRSGNKRSTPQRNGRYDEAGRQSQYFSRAHQGEKRNPSYYHGIMRG